MLFIFYGDFDWIMEADSIRFLPLFMIGLFSWELMEVDVTKLLPIFNEAFGTWRIDAGAVI